MIPTVQDCIERGEGGTDHYVTQFLTGHGSFGTYSRRIWKVDTIATKSSILVESRRKPPNREITKKNKEKKEKVLQEKQ